MLHHCIVAYWVVVSQLKFHLTRASHFVKAMTMSKHHEVLRRTRTCVSLVSNDPCSTDFTTSSAPLTSKEPETIELSSSDWHPLFDSLADSAFSWQNKCSFKIFKQPKIVYIWCCYVESWILHGKTQILVQVSKCKIWNLIQYSLHHEEWLSSNPKDNAWAWMKTS